jgi:hypothetical protein
MSVDLSAWWLLVIFCESYFHTMMAKTKARLKWPMNEW